METKTVSKPKIKDFSINRETYDHANKEKNVFKAEEGLSEELVREKGTRMDVK